MPKQAPSRLLSSAQLTKATAERVFGWKGVHKHGGKLIGKKQDRTGRWRKANVPDYSGEQRLAYAIDERMKELGRWDRYIKELSRLPKPRTCLPNGPLQSSDAKLH